MDIAIFIWEMGLKRVKHVGIHLLIPIYKNKGRILCNLISLILKSYRKSNSHKGNKIKKISKGMVRRIMNEN